MISRRNFLRSGAALAAFAAAPSVRGAGYGILGQRAPQLDVARWIGPSGAPMTFDPRSLDGRYVLLKFFQSWCPGCHKYGFPAMKRVADAFADEPRVQLLAVQTVFEGFGVNTPAQLAPLQRRYELPIPFGHDAGDPDGNRAPRTMRDYRSGGTPWLVFIDTDATVLYNDFHLGADRLIAWLRTRFA